MLTTFLLFTPGFMFHGVLCVFFHGIPRLHCTSCTDDASTIRGTIQGQTDAMLYMQLVWPWATLMYVMQDDANVVATLMVRAHHALDIIMFCASSQASL